MYHFIKVLIAFFSFANFQGKKNFVRPDVWVRNCFAVIICSEVSRRFSKLLLAKESCLAYALEN
jgi:hypothetical protein